MDQTKHNYYKKLMKLYELGKIPTTSLAEVDIYHDDWCGINMGDYCNCDPDIALRPQLSGNVGGNDSAQGGVISPTGALKEDTIPLQPPTTPCPTRAWPTARSSARHPSWASDAWARRSSTTRGYS